MQINLPRYILTQENTLREDPNGNIMFVAQAMDVIAPLLDKVAALEATLSAAEPVATVAEMGVGGMRVLMPHPSGSTDHLPIGTKLYAAPPAPSLSAQVQDVAGWQLIETAPKDGTNILVWADGYQWPEVVRYEIYGDPTVEAEAGESGYWRFSEDLLADITHIDKDEISHWMPLPSSPAMTLHEAKDYALKAVKSSEKQEGGE